MALNFVGGFPQLVHSREKRGGEEERRPSVVDDYEAETILFN
jgi:hypothetical protein